MREGFLNGCNDHEKRLWACLDKEFANKYQEHKQKNKIDQDTWQQSKELNKQMNMFMEKPEKYEQFVKNNQDKN